jgi:hypothetical protein
MKEVIFPRGHAIEEAPTITAMVMAARAAIDSEGDVRFVYKGNESTYTLRHALGNYNEYAVEQRIRELRARLIELNGERDSILKEIEAEGQYLSKAQKLVSPET